MVRGIKLWRRNRSFCGAPGLIIVSELFKRLLNCLKNEELVAMCTVLVGPGLGGKLLVWPDGQTMGGLGSAQLNRQVSGCAIELLKAQKSERRILTRDEQHIEVFIDVFSPSPKLIIIGGVHVAIPLIHFAKLLGFRSILVDPRSFFATPQRFSHADELFVAWPQEVLSSAELTEVTYLVVLSHDEKVDNPALRLALESRCRYIGALGSSRTHARRVASLKEMGVTDEQLARVHAPIGLDLGGRRPEEIALSIIAQIVSVRNGRA